MSPFHDWETFYVIVGSSAAALTGLQFVVIALIADVQARSTTREIEAFASPTIIHFGAVLLLSGILTAPWHGLGAAALLLGVCGFSGIVYTALVVRRVRHQTLYKLVKEDWLFHTVLPAIAYGLLTAAALTLSSHPHRALFATGATALLLLFIGIHNAWDTVTYIVVASRQQEMDKPQSR
jgi:hypothetical protein